MASDGQESFEDLKVNAWLQHQSTHISTTAEWVLKVNRKRKRGNASHCIQTLDRRRNPLRETTMNSPAKDAEPDHSKRSKKGLKTPTQQRQPLRMSPRKNMHPTQLVDGRADTAGYSGALQHADITLLPRRGTMSNSSTQSRSSSPVKTIHDLTMADPPITFFEANSKKIQPPQAIVQLYKRVLDVSDGFNLLPESLKVRDPFILMWNYADKYVQDSIISYCTEFETKTPRNQYFKQSSNSPTMPTQEEINTWEAVMRIRGNATKCSEDGDSEAGWGEMVYSQILDEAIKQSRYKHGVGWKNMYVLLFFALLASHQPSNTEPPHVLSPNLSAQNT